MLMSNEPLFIYLAVASFFANVQSFRIYCNSSVLIIFAGHY